jgi:hypothetical protein
MRLALLIPNRATGKLRPEFGQGGAAGGFDDPISRLDTKLEVFALE